MTVRLKDIAADLGISAMAVSKALRGHKDIGEETRRRVAKRAAELGYRVDQVARSMVTGRTFLVGLIVPDLMQSFFAEIAHALSAGLAQAGYHVVIANSDEDAEDELQEIDLLVSRKVDGLVIASAQHGPARLTALRVPYVLIDRRIEGVDAHFVGSSDEALGAMATEHLIAQGCRRVAHLAGPDSSAARGRRAGFIEALARHGLPAGVVVDAGHGDREGAAAMRALLARGERPDGVFAFNDPVAAGAMRAILEAGLRLPGDIALIGAANMYHGDMLRVPLSTIDQGTADIGAEAARLLLDAMTTDLAPSPREVSLPLTLVARASSLRFNSPA